MSYEVVRHPIDGAELACVDTGPTPGGKTVLLVHGFPLTHAVWNEQIAALGKQHRVIAPDLRGYGESTLGGWPQENDASDARLARYAEDLAGLLDALGVERVVYCGFSMGGYIAWPFLDAHADQLEALVLADTRVIADDDAARATRLKMAAGVAEWGSARVAAIMRPNLFGPNAPDSVVDATVQQIAAVEPRAIAASQHAMAARPDSTGRLASLALPTLVLVGEEDRISTTEEMRGFAAEIPGAEFVVIEDSGHLTPVEQAERFNAALLAFLERL